MVRNGNMLDVMWWRETGGKGVDNKMRRLVNILAKNYYRHLLHTYCLWEVSGGFCTQAPFILFKLFTNRPQEGQEGINRGYCCK